MVRCSGDGTDRLRYPATPHTKDTISLVVCKIIPTLRQWPLRVLVRHFNHQLSYYRVSSRAVDGSVLDIIEGEVLSVQLLTARRPHS